MSAGQIIGGVAGGIIGFVFGGLVGAAAGVGLGAGIGGYIDPPRGPEAGKPQISQLNITTAKEGDIVPELLGISKITGNIIQYWGNRTEEVKEEQESGKGGGSGSTVITGYNHYLSWLQGIVLGETDYLYAVYKEENVVWFGELERPVSGGMSTITLTDYSDDEGNGTIIGNMTFYFGTNDQAQNASFLDGIPDSTLNVPYRNLCYAFFDDCLLGGANRAPIFSFIVGKRPVISFNASETINTYDYNPSHAIWWILENMTDLPTSFLDETSFNNVANTLVSEEFGVSILFDKTVSANNYIDNILLHIGGIKYYDTDGKLKLKLIREDEDEDDMLSISDDDLIEKPSITRGSWVETVNEIHGIYPLRFTLPVRPPSSLPFGEWVAALTQRTTNYVYLYDIDLKAVIQIDLKASPKVVDVLYLNPLYGLDYNKGYKSAQKGGYCINKSETRLWYLFRTGDDCELIEVDITNGDMSLVDKTDLLSLISSETIMDGCADDDYTYWGTDLTTGRIIKLKNSDHSIEDNHLFTLTLYFGNNAYTQGITQLDVLPSLDKLFFSAVQEGGPGLNATAVYYRSDTSFNIEVESPEGNIGFNTPWWQNLMQIHDSFLFHHRAYWPSNGLMLKWTDTGDDTPVYDYSDAYGYDQQYLLNMLGKNDSYFFTHWEGNVATPPYYLQCFNFDNITLVDTLEVTSYLGDSRASALNNDLIALFRYDIPEQANYTAAFTAGSTIALVSDTKMDLVYWK